MRLPTAQTVSDTLHMTSDPVERITSNPVNSRDDLVNLLYDLLIPLQAGQSEGGARIKIGHTGTHFDQVAAELEGYARALWGLAPMLAADPENSKFADLKVAWVRGLDNGTNPDHEEYWGDHIDNDQRFVEMAAIVSRMRPPPQSTDSRASLCPSHQMYSGHPKLKKPRRGSITGSCRLIDLTSPPTTGDVRHKIPPEASLLRPVFRVLINLGLRLVGAEYSQQAIEDELSFIESYYGSHVGHDTWSNGGWWVLTVQDFPSDGPNDTCKAYDYYATSFAIPFYSLIYARLAGSFDSERAERYRKRAIQNIPEVAHLFAPDGAAIPFGRSMTYRFACSAFWGALAYDDIEVGGRFMII